jgi:LmbE family N-acetylglucosaminyl deacetylase
MPESISEMPEESPDAALLDDPSGIERILMVAAHPDDIDFGAAGSVAVWTGLGLQVVYCIVTDGDAGGSDRSISRAEMAAIRREEQRAAAAEVGVDEVIFLGYADGRLVPSLELRRDLSREVRRFRPQRVVCPSPERNWERINASHPDHLAAGEATVCAVYPDARNPFAHPELLQEGLEPHTVPQLWLSAHPRRNRAIDVTDTFQQKLAALRCHRSQVGEGEWLEERIGDFLARIGKDAGLPEGRLAEAFYSVGIL